MSSEPRRLAIAIRNLSKKYPIYDRPADKLLELLFARRIQRHREFWALRDVDLEVEPGMTLGILGQNGSGKSTLLQIVAGILQQTRGDCYVDGSVSALLELGAGFNPEFTGRDNVFMNGTILGLTHHEIVERFDEIASFAGIGEFMDRPVKTYSSGMFMRLAFAIAVHVDPEILLVDEALAVGDLMFQHRCINRIRRLRDSGKTVLFVTHDLHAVTQFCQRAILLDQGRKVADGDPETVVQRYRALISRRERGEVGTGKKSRQGRLELSLPVIKGIPNVDHRYGNGGAEIVGVELQDSDQQPASTATSGESLRLLVTFRGKRCLESPIVGFTVRDRLGVEVTASNTEYEECGLPTLEEGQQVTVAFCFQVPALRPGSYSISPAVSDGTIWDHTVEDWVDNACHFDLFDTGLIYGAMKWPVEASYRISEGSV